MKQLVLVRHGQSTWNLQNRFTGWVDVDLSERGVNEARDAGRTLKARGYRFDLAMTSFFATLDPHPGIDSGRNGPDVPAGTD